MRVGFGYDSHILVPGRKLWVGGVKIPAKFGALAHSDGDVLIHALMDALLGAAAKGNIGQYFPDTDPAYKNISSIKLLESVVKDLKIQVLNVDATVILDRPKLNNYLPKMKICLSKILNQDKINLKPKTSENQNPNLIEAFVVLLAKEF